MAHERLIASLFPDKAERQTASAIVAALPSTMHEDRVVALCHELSRPVPDGQTGEQSVAYIADFLNAIGGMPNESQAFLRWVDAGDPGTDIRELVSPEPQEDPDTDADDGDRDTRIITVDMAALAMPRPAPAPPGPTRAQLQAQIRQHESNMRAPQGSEAWRSYGQHGGDAEYRAALQALETAPPTSPASTTDGDRHGHQI